MQQSPLRKNDQNLGLGATNQFNLSSEDKQRFQYHSPPLLDHLWLVRSQWPSEQRALASAPLRWPDQIVTPDHQRSVAARGHRHATNFSDQWPQRDPNKFHARISRATRLPTSPIPQAIRRTGYATCEQHDSAGGTVTSTSLFPARFLRYGSDSHTSPSLHAGAIQSPHAIRGQIIPPASPHVRDGRKTAPAPGDAPTTSNKGDAKIGLGPLQTSVNQGRVRKAAES